MTTLTENVRLSTYLKGIVENFLDVATEDNFPTPPSSLYFAMMTAEEVETASYTGYERKPAAPEGYGGPTSTRHCSLDIEFTGGSGDAHFAAVTAPKTLHSIGIYDAATAGNLLLWIPFSITLQTGDELALDTLSVYFNNESAISYSKANSCAFLSQMIARWLVNQFVETDSVTSKRFDEINEISKDRRCMIVESTGSTTGVVWGYPTGGPPLIGSTGATVVKHATQVDSDGNGDVTVKSIISTTTGSALALTMAQTGLTTWQMADYGAPFSGSVTKVTYGVVVQEGTNPPFHIAGVLGDDSANEFVPLAIWTPSGANWSFTAETTKLAWTLGMSLERRLLYVPAPTYDGDLTGITTVNPKQLTSSGGYSYEHSLVSMHLSQLTYSIATVYDTQEYEFSTADSAIPITAYAFDPIAELVDLRQYSTDVRSGDTHLSFSVKLRTADGDIPNTSGKSVVVRYSVNGGATSEVRGSVPTNYATTGRVIFALPAAAFASPGQVRAEITLQGSGGSVQTFPTDDTVFISIMRSL